jgi:hypothetical protein
MSRYQSQGVVALLTASTTTETGSTHIPNHKQRTFDANGTTTAGAGAATILIEGSNEGIANTWITIGTITLTLGTTKTADGFTTDAPWKFVRARVSAISGTNASVNANMGC